MTNDIVESIHHKGYTVEIHYDDDAINPLKDFDGQPTLVLHSKAEDHFGWTTDEHWGQLLNRALDELNNRHPLDQCLQIIQLWLRVFHGVTVVLPVGAGQHSGTWVYLGTGASFSDPGGWDSGWVGWLFWTPKEVERNLTGHVRQADGTEVHLVPSAEELEKMLTGSFEEFAAYVAGQVYGYVIRDPDGGAVDDDSCWGFYGDSSYEEGGHMRDQFISVIDYDAARKHQTKVDLFKKLVNRS